MVEGIAKQEILQCEYFIIVVMALTIYYIVFKIIIIQYQLN